MVMAPAHAAMGLAAGLAAAHFLPPVVDAHPSAGTQLVFGMLTAGAAIVPDLDHPQATASTTLGPISRIPAKLINETSRVIYQATRTRYDEDRGGDHRGITHTIPGALFFASAVAAAAYFGGHWGVIAALWVVTLFALRALPPVHGALTDMVAAAALAAAAMWILPPGAAPAWLGAAMLLGCLVHDLGDAPTESGCPLLFPVKIRKQRWYPVSLPRILRFRAANRLANKLILLLALGASAYVCWLMLEPHLFPVATPEATP